MTRFIGEMDLVPIKEGRPPQFNVAVLLGSKQSTEMARRSPATGVI